jgi:UTP--glucose-1-phosphate uridylyltransferase
MALSGKKALSQAVLIKLNGGLGTSMGLEKAKSLLIVKNGLCFLDIIAKQALLAKIPLVLMNSFSTREDSLALLARYPALSGKIPLDFLQHKAPKVAQADLSPVTWPKDPSLEWYPPGHGDIYTALLTSRMLDTLLSAGKEYAFISNADNLGAIMDLPILGYFAEKNLPFMMEAADRTQADKKGGHLAVMPDGGLLLRESAQCPESDMGAFQDVSRHRYFNTNSLWVNLTALKKLMAERENILGLPMIRNAKTVDPRDPASPAVYQIETAMGSAIGVFKGASALRVPRTRFAPVKTTSDLLAVRSDNYDLTVDFQVRLNPARKKGPTVVSLDKHYKFMDQMESRFPGGAPSLIQCDKFIVKGDFIFGSRITCKGEAEIVNLSGKQRRVPDGTLLSGKEEI